MHVKVRLTVLKDKQYVSAPQYSTTTPASAGNADYYVTTGVDKGDGVHVFHDWALILVSIDIREASRSAFRSMVASLGAEKGLSRENAYILCSVAADLRLHEVVSFMQYVRLKYINISPLG